MRGRGYQVLFLKESTKTDGEHSLHQVILNETTKTTRQYVIVGLKGRLGIVCRMRQGGIEPPL